MKRVFLIVLDSVGIGAAKDAQKYGDIAANTMLSISKSEKFNIPRLLKMGLGNIDGIDYLNKTDSPTAAVGKLCEVSCGKDTTTGHWEIAGLKLEKPFPTYPDGFPDEVINEFVRRTGRGVLCNKPYSGTDVIRDYGEEHLKTGKLIVYTSADSVFQIAVHEDVIPTSELYRYCVIARELLQGKHGVGRVIARPFAGKYPFKRTSGRHDYSMPPIGKTVLDAIKETGLDVISVGKINDILAGSGITESIKTTNNNEGMAALDDLVAKDFTGLCFANLVDFDMVYGHRNDIHGYANSLSEFDKWLGSFLPKLKKDDMLIVTADHGCDPGDTGTDHTREYVPVLFYGEKIKPVNLGVVNGFYNIAKTVADVLKVEYSTYSVGFKGDIL